MATDILFYVLAALTLIFGALVVANPFSRNPVTSAMFLVLTIISMAGLFVLLHAYFLAAVQVLVYAGAVMVLFVFVIMLLNAGVESKKGKSLVVQLLGVPLLVTFLGLMAYFVQRMFPTATSVHFGGFTGGGVKEIGMAMFTTYVLPFEATSLLILIAILGAIVLARKEMD